MFRWIKMFCGGEDHGYQKENGITLMTKIPTNAEGGGGKEMAP